MSRDDGGLEYPNLSACHVHLTGSATSSRPPVRLPESVSKALADVNGDSRTPYDFSLGKHGFENASPTTCLS
jgi:hypothetical protein